MVRYSITLITLLTIGFGQSNVPDKLFLEGNQAMTEEDYRAAADKYEEILAQGYTHKNLFYNLGNAYYRLGYNGLAIWAYEKGLQLDPQDGDLKYNLAIANAQVRDRIEAPDMVFILEWYRLIKSLFSIQQWIFIGLGLAATGGIIFNINRFTSNSGFGKNLVFIMLILSAVCHSIALNRYWDNTEYSEAVIVDTEVFAYSAPFERSDIMLFKIHEGIKVEIVQSQDDWTEIILLDGKQGWIRSDTIRGI